MWTYCSPRLVSISVVIDIDAPHETDTNWVTLYGQFVDHDLTSTPVFRMSMFYHSHDSVPIRVWILQCPLYSFKTQMPTGWAFSAVRKMGNCSIIRNCSIPSVCQLSFRPTTRSSPSLASVAWASFVPLQRPDSTAVSATENRWVDWNSALCVSLFSPKEKHCNLAVDRWNVPAQHLQVVS